MVLDVATLHRRARRVLPEKLHTCGIVVEQDDPASLAARLLPLGHVRRGALCFRLAPETLRSLAALSLDYLQDAVQAREGLGRRAAPVVYRQWCERAGHSLAQFQTVSRDGRASLTVIPHCQLAIYAWDDAGLAGEGTAAWSRWRSC